MTLTRDVKREAEKAGFVAVGVSNIDMLRGLPYGKTKNVGTLKTPEEVLPGVKSVVLMGIHAWDPVFNIVADSTILHFDKKHKPSVPLEGYQLYHQVALSKAWKIARFLMKKGYEAIPSFGIPLKTCAVKCGLGCQGKNTLLVTPTYGPRVRLVSLLTTGDLEVDEPFTEDLCGSCDKCLRVCPARAIEPYKLNVNKCMVYASENPRSRKVPVETRELERRLVKRPTPNSLIECSTCLEACPIGQAEG